MAKSKAKQKDGGIVETVKTVVYAVAIAIGIRTVAYEPFNIPSESMLPTLWVGDYLFVSKFSLGYSRFSLPFDLGLLLPAGGRVPGWMPERGDVAVFKLPSDNSTDYIKRIIGLPGDRIQMKGGALFLNGTEVQRRPLAPFRYEGRFGNDRVPQYMETLPGGRTYRTLDLRTSSSTDDTGVYTVPEGHVFAMGDNRDNSLDSRVSPNDNPPGVGFVPLENIVGRADVLFFSTDGTASLLEPWKWPFATRYIRIFNAVE